MEDKKVIADLQKMVDAILEKIADLEEEIDKIYDRFDNSDYNEY